MTIHFWLSEFVKASHGTTEKHEQRIAIETPQSYVKMQSLICGCNIFYPGHKKSFGVRVFSVVPCDVLTNSESQKFIVIRI